MTGQSEISITLKCSDSDIASFLILLHAIYEDAHKSHFGGFSLLPIIGHALGFLRDQLSYLMSPDGEDILDSDGVIESLAKPHASIVNRFLSI